MPKHVRANLAVAVALAAAVTAAACGKKAPDAEVAAPVKAAPAIRGSIREIVTADAVLFPRDQAAITPKVSAPVRRFLVNRGDHVKKGQLLAELENTDLTAAAAESLGQYGQAQSNFRSMTQVDVPEQLVKAQTDFEAAREGADAAKRVLESREQLFKEGALARKAVDEAQVASVQASGQLATAGQHLKALQEVARDEQVKNAQAQVDAAKGHYDAASAMLSYSRILSPIDGVITDRPAYAGEMATSSAPLLTVMDTSVVVARANMSLAQAKDIKAGDEATVTPSDGGDPVDGKVTTVSPAVDLNSTTVQVWVQVENADGALRAGGSARVAIVARTIVGATLVPVSAVLPSDEGGSKVLVVDDKDVAHEKPVETGAREHGQVQITGGLEPGERVITVGGLGLDDKAKVHVLKPGEKLPGQVDEKDDEDEQ